MAMHRRTFLRAGTGIAGTIALTGCLSRFFETQSQSAQAPPLVENRPEAVYYPSHIEGMKMAGMAKAKWYMAGLMFSFPHRFWIVTGQNRKKVELKENDSVHLMASVWDRETKIVPPNANLRIEVTKDGESVASKSLWPMISQNMGYHFGDNVSLSGDGTYTVTVRVGPMDTRRTGPLKGKFGEPAKFEFKFDYSQKKLRDIMFKRLEEKKGQKGAVEPMQMEMMPLAQVPPKEKLPGKVVGDATSGDGVFVVTTLEQPPEGIDKSGRYLAVSARTPYNRYPLPFMSVSGTLTRNGESVFDGALTPTLDPDLNYHYGATVDDIKAGDTLELSIGAPPQVARHEGYETAFFEMSPMELTIKSA